MRRQQPLPYSPYADFVVMRQMTLLGRDYQYGEDLDKTGLTDRQLLKLFEARKIAPKAFAGDAPAFFHNAQANQKAREAIAAAEREAREAEGGGSEAASPLERGDGGLIPAEPTVDAVDLYSQIAQQRETATGPAAKRTRARAAG